MKIVDEPTCKFCEKDETAEHIMCECEAYSRLRFMFIGKLTCTLEDFANIATEDFIKFSKRIMHRMWTPLNG